LDGTNFLLCNDGTNDRILIYATINFFEKASDGRKLFMDGTFKCCPNLFAQLYTIHAFEDYGGTAKKMIPLVYILMPHRNQVTYERVFTILRDCGKIWICYIFNEDVYRTVYR
jgi:hypothetical protein